MQRLYVALRRDLRVLPLHVHRGRCWRPDASGGGALPPPAMAAKDAPDLGTYIAPAAPGGGDDDVLAELEREVEALNEADADDAAQVVGGTGRDADGDLAAAFQEYRQQRLAEMQAQYVCLLMPGWPRASAPTRVIQTAGATAMSKTKRNF